MSEQVRLGEAWAGECLTVALPGAAIQIHDDNTHDSMYDLVMLRHGVPFAACEVTAATDANSTELWKLVNDRTQRWIEPSLRQGWIVHLEPRCRAKKLQRILPALLACLEVDLWDWETREELKTLGAASWRSIETQFPGVIYPLLERPHELTGGIVPTSGDPLVDWFEDWVNEPSRVDNLAKLTDTGLGERHLFVIAPAFSTMPFGAYDLLLAGGSPLPTRAMKLPAPLTHAWFASTWDTGDVFTYDGSTWARHGKPEGAGVA